MTRAAGGGCPVCGSAHAACGPATTTTIGVDERTQEATAMADVREYTVVVSGNETTMQLSDADAERLGVKPATKQQDEPDTKKREPANKSRTADDKS